MLISVQTQRQAFPKGFMVSISRPRVGQEMGITVGQVACSFAPTGAEELCEESCIHLHVHFNRSHAPSIKEYGDRADRYFQIKPDMVKKNKSFRMMESSFQDDGLSSFSCIYLYIFFYCRG